MGRPSSFTQETADAICDRLAHGESLRKICRDEDMPSSVAVLRWCDSNEQFRAQYARARADQADHLAEECVDIADSDPALLFDESKRSGATVVIDAAAIAHQRLRIDARRWFAGKVAPKKYGEKLEHHGTLTLAQLIEKQGEKD